jgi:cytochrome P450
LVIAKSTSIAEDGVTVSTSKNVSSSDDIGSGGAERHAGLDAAAIPHSPLRLPLVGDLFDISRTAPTEAAIRLGRKLGPIFTQRFFNMDIVFVSGADLVAELSDESRFAKHVGLGLRRLRSLGGDGLFTAHNHEPNWQKAHDILLPAFALSSMQAYHPTMLDAAKQLLGSWDSHVDGAPVDVTADMTKLTLETIAAAGFGYPFGSFERDEPHPFVTAMVRVLNFAQLQNRQLPWIGPLLNRRASRRNVADTAFMVKIVDDVIKARKASGDTTTGDLLGLMLNAPHPTSGQPLDEANIRNQVITFLIAGHETTSGALSFALYYLVKNPTVLAKAQAEVDAVLGAEDDPTPTFKQVGKLRYVRRVLDEALRLWPTAPAFLREARADTVLGGKYPMRKGERVVVLIPMLHRDPVWGEDVEAFDPDRFTSERIKARPAHSYKPFGTGERACIGRQFAVHEATLVLGLLLHRYRLSDHANYQLRVMQTLTVKPDGFTLTLTRRRPQDRLGPSAVNGSGTVAPAAADEEQPVPQCPMSST